MAKNFSVFVEIGGKVGPSFGGAIKTAEDRLASLGRSAVKSAGSVNRALGRIADPMKHAGVLAAGAGGLHGTVSTSLNAIHAGAELQGVKVDMQKAGIAKSEIDAIWRQSLDLAARYKNITQSGVMELAKEVRSVMTDSHEVFEVMPSLAAAKSLLDARDRTGQASHGLAQLIKGAETIGAAKDPHRFIGLLDGYVKAMQVMGKTITPEGIYEFDKYSKIAGARLSDRFLLTTAQSLSQELGGSTAGLGVGGLYKQVSGGMQNLHTAAQEFARVGLIDAKNLEHTKTGEIKGVKKGVMHAVKGDTLAATDPDKWVYEIVLPAIEAAGIKTAGDQLAWVRKAFPNSNVSDLIGKIIVQRTAFEAHAKQYGDATGLKGVEYNRDDPTAALGSVTGSLKTFAGILTDPIMKDAANGLDWLGAKIGGFSKALEAFNAEHPWLAKAEAPVAGAVALGGATAAGGLAWKALTSGFGLKGSALALDSSAVALTAAAAKLGWKPPVVTEVAKHAAPAAATAGLTFGVGGSIIAGGAVLGAGLDMLTPGTNAGVGGLLTGRESSLAQTMRVRREEAQAAARPFPAPWQTAKPKVLAGAKGQAGGYTSAVPTSRGAVGDFLFGQDKQSLTLPTFGRGLKMELPQSAITSLHDSAAKAGEQAGTKAGEQIGSGIEASGGTIAAKASAVFEQLQSIFSKGISVPMRPMPGGGGGGVVAAAPSHAGVPLAGARALGGPVTGGKPYLVGERGPEIFVPGATGRIETNGTLRKLSAAGSTSKLASVAAPTSPAAGSTSKLAALGSTGGASPLRAPTAGDMVSAGVNGGGGLKTGRGGDTSIVNNWTINGATDPEGVRRQVDARFRALIAQMESEQRGLLSD